jgi:D-amino-acid dehydrogenase
LRIAVIGAGIIGVTTAYELAADGHQVSVLEQRQAVASEASFANAGVVAPGYVSPWAAPWMPLKVLAGLFGTHAAVRFGAGAFGAPLWMSRYLWACRRTAHLANRRRMQRLAIYSRERLDALTLVHGLEYEQQRGYLILLRSAAELARAQRGLPLLAELGVAHEMLDGAGARLREPALSEGAPLHAALSLPGDLVGNCRQFAQVLKARAVERGVQFRFGTRVVRLSRGHPGGLYWSDADNPTDKAHAEEFDAIVLCTGQLPPQLGRKLGVRVPVLPVFGYSMTAPVRHREGEPDPGPRSGVMDERYKVAITRLGQRIRVAGIAEVGCAPDVLRDAPLNTLYKVLADWFDGAADISKVQHWKGARPMLPDGPPVIGPAGPPQLWLNLGHGSSGWALSCGSARVLADLVAGRTPEIDPEGLGLERLR